MWHDVDSLQRFYGTPLGRATGHFLTRAIAQRWETGKRMRFLGLGFTPPVMKPMTMQAERTVLAMPGRQGVIDWTDRSKGKNQTCLVDETALPFTNHSFDRIVAAHLIEVSGSKLDCLSEVWRVLQPEGQFILIVPNRLGLWARLENNPMGLGSPFTPGQITRLLNNANFHVEGVGQALFFPPFERRALLRVASSLDRWVRPFVPAGGGALIVSARKRVSQPIKRPGLAQRLPKLWDWPPIGSPVGAPQSGSAPFLPSEVCHLGRSFPDAHA